jgi:hypothetical protein
MIRRLDQRRATIVEIRKRERVKAHVADQLPRGQERKPRAARTDIIICVVCRRSYPLGTHDTLVCARANGLDGNDTYRLSHALVSLCAGRCGKVVTSAGAVCVSCIREHSA